MDRYATEHANPGGAGDARPTALQIIHDEGLEGKLVDKVIVVTGATSGIGLETVRALSATGATLILTVRDMEKAQIALDGVFGPKHMSLVEMDNGSLKSVRSAAAKILAKSNGRVNVLINNAGVMGLPELMLTDKGHEMHFATNHLSHFLLFQLLRPALLASSVPTFHSRVVNVASSAHRVSPLPDSDDYNFERGQYHFGTAYGNSKLANVYMTNELDRRYGHKGVHGLSVQPGAIGTNLSRHVDPSFVQQIMQNEAVIKVLKSPKQGAATTVFAAVSREWEHRGGKYLEDCAEARRGEDDGDSFGVGYVKHTYNEEAESRLWKDSLKMVGLW